MEAGGLRKRGSDAFFACGVGQGPDKTSRTKGSVGCVLGSARGVIGGGTRAKTDARCAIGAARGAKIGARGVLGAASCVLLGARCENGAVMPVLTPEIPGHVCGSFTRVKKICVHVRGTRALTDGTRALKGARRVPARGSFRHVKESRAHVGGSRTRVGETRVQVRESRVPGPVFTADAAGNAGLGNVALQKFRSQPEGLVLAS